MTKYIDKTMIEKILHKLWKEDKGYGYIDIARTSYNKALQEVQCEIDALEVKEVDLEKEIANQYESNYEEYLTYEEFADIAKHFFELGMQVSNKSQK
jgi:hypothetical protein